MTKFNLNQLSNAVQAQTPTLASLAALTTTQTIVQVSANDGTGGIFGYLATSLTADGGVIIAATGRGTGYWVRLFNVADGVKVSWWGDTDAGIDSAIACAGTNGKIHFTPNKTYQQSKTHTPLAGQIWMGNNATLQRQTETATTISGTVLSSASSFTVASVPSTWHVGDMIQFYVSQSTLGASPVLFINNISGNVVSISGTVGTALGNAATSYASPSVWKVWNQIDQTSTLVNFDVYNLNFDGNQTTSCPNIYWGANKCMYVIAPQIRIANCNFINMGSDCIQGHGLSVTGCTYNNLNNSFVHLTADFSHSPALYPSNISGNKGTNSNQILSSTGSMHSEGVITLSNTGGYANIENNWFKGGLDAFIGAITMSTTSVSGASRFLRVHHNQLFNLNRGPISNIVADNTETTKPGIIQFDNNTFDNCGTTSPFPATLNASWAYIDKISWYGNTLSNGTTITIPAEVYPVDIIANTNGTSNIQTGMSFNIDGSGQVGTSLTVGTLTQLTGNTVIGTSANTAISLGVRKNITGGTTAYGIYNDGQIQSSVTSAVNINYSRPSTQAASFTLPVLRHYYANGTSVGSGSSVTNEYGFYAESTITDGTSNYGFFSNLAAASNVWGYYASGTAQNYFAGKTGIGPSVNTPDAYLKLGAGTATAGTAPLKLTSGTLLSSTEGGAIEYDGTSLYMTIFGKRGSMPLTQGQADLTAQTSAGTITTLTTAGVPTAQTFNVSAYLNVTAIATDVIQVQITYTDENNTSQTVSLANISAVGNSTYSPVVIRVKTGTVITVKTNLSTSGGSVTFDAGARITLI